MVRSLQTEVIVQRVGGLVVDHMRRIWYTEAKSQEGRSIVTNTIRCCHCGSDQVVRNGHAPNKKQIYRCRACQRQSREHPTPQAYPEDRRQEILRAYQERSSLRGLQRTFGVSRTTVVKWIKKTAHSSFAQRDPGSC